MKQYGGRRYQHGMTLIELMIAMLIGIFLLGGLIRIFTNSRHAYNLQQAVGQVQENGRFALDFLGNDLRMADFWECRANNFDILGLPPVNPINGTADLGVTGTDDIGVNNADSITVAWTLGTWTPNNLTCMNAGAVWVRYTVGVSSSGNGTSLFRQTNTDAQPIELIEGVNNMQILYGEDTDPPTNRDYSPNYYVPYGLVQNMSNVVSIRVSLLLSSLSNVATQPVGYVYQGVTVSDPGDFKLYRVFTTTIALRNRIP
ncbi:PilW family protein [Methylovulum psychrotolerans]|uniref:Prepilin-type N-terminal cleavage/methylation domain-containing protein n=1 Tax=Methylovulum psychrotolerans TaxID=1704499 RepID=A0A2S5CJ76_9GAMM|nr:PilW family protein [Methylovulum psychrotolerans]POZ50863.1 hypothetical protein AADEFJLK_03335 [Methylovulum psychrotolerans]